MISLTAGSLKSATTRIRQSRARGAQSSSTFGAALTGRHQGAQPWPKAISLDWSPGCVPTGTRVTRFCPRRNLTKNGARGTCLTYLKSEHNRSVTVHCILALFSLFSSLCAAGLILNPKQTFAASIQRRVRKNKLMVFRFIFSVAPPL